MEEQFFFNSLLESNQVKRVLVQKVFSFGSNFSFKFSYWSVQYGCRAFQESDQSKASSIMSWVVQKGFQLVAENPGEWDYLGPSEKPLPWQQEFIQKKKFEQTPEYQQYQQQIYQQQYQQQQYQQQLELQRKLEHEQKIQKE